LVTSSAAPPLSPGPDLGERLAKLAVLALLAGLMWGALLGAVRIAQAIID